MKTRMSTVVLAAALLPSVAFAQTKMTVNPQSFTIGAGEEKYITAKEIGAPGAQAAVFGGSCLEHRYLRERSSDWNAATRTIEVRVARTKTPPLGNGKCNIIFALRGRDGWTDQTNVRVTLTK